MSVTGIVLETWDAREEEIGVAPAAKAGCENIRHTNPAVCLGFTWSVAGWLAERVGTSGGLGGGGVSRESWREGRKRVREG